MTEPSYRPRYSAAPPCRRQAKPKPASGRMSPAARSSKPYSLPQARRYAARDATMAPARPSTPHASSGSRSRRAEQEQAELGAVSWCTTYFLQWETVLAVYLNCIEIRTLKSARSPTLKIRPNPGVIITNPGSSPPRIRVPHLRRGFIATKVGYRAKRDPLSILRRSLQNRPQLV